MVVGKGEALPDLSLPLLGADFPLLVQLLTTNTGVCWQGEYANPADVVTNEANLFKARAR